MRLLFDSIIFSFLVIDGFLLAVFLIQFIRHFKKTFTWISASLFVAFLGAFVVVFYGSFIEPRMIVVAEATIEVAKDSSQQLRVALVSDFHVGPYKKEDFVEKAVQKILSLKPDLILLAGDFVYDDEDQVQYLTPLKNLQAPYGVYAVLGNHEYGEGHREFGAEGEKRSQRVYETLRSLGMNILVNEGIKITKNGQNLYFLGTDDLWTDRASIDLSVRSLGLSSLPHPTVLVSHNPDIVVEAEKMGVDAVLAGHTHGGQIRLPLLGAVPDIPDELGRAYDRGLFQFGKTLLYITSGIGEMGPRARLLVPPEIALLTISF